MMTTSEMDEALEEIGILERRRARLMERARFLDSTDPARADMYYGWADCASDEIGRRKDALWIAYSAAAHEARAQGEYPA